MQKFLIFLLFAMNNTFAQMPDSTQYLKPLSPLLHPRLPIDTVKVFDNYKRGAEEGKPDAMYFLAEMYFHGHGTAKDINKSIYWFEKAAEQNNPKALSHIGFIYKRGLVGTPDYEKAYKYFCRAADLGDLWGITFKGYMLYSGFGCKQDYAAAYELFQIASKKGYPEAMRFVGLCMRNGYGTAVNEDSAKYWLRKWSSFHHFNSDFAEYGIAEYRDLAGSLVDRVKAAQALIKQNPVNVYTKIQHNLPANEIEGTYEGWLLRYDWSGKHVTKADKLKVVLKYEGDSLKGSWIENDTSITPIHAVLTNKGLLFSKMYYRKKDNYNFKTAQLLKFEKALLQLSKDKSATYISGDLQLYAVKRREPAKPMYVALARTIAGSNNNLITFNNENKNDEVTTYPNPFTNILNVDFELQKKSSVQINLLTINGQKVFSNTAQQLPAGTFNIPMQIDNLKPGTYFLQLMRDNKAVTLKVIKL